MSHALPTLASKIDIPNKAVDMKVIKKSSQATTTDFIPAKPINKKDLGTQSSSSVTTKELKGFTLLMATYSELV